MSQRVYKFDIIKVLLMVLVVMAHTLKNSYGSLYHETLRYFLLFYTMPMFTFISGYFSKPNRKILPILMDYLFPFLLFSTIYHFYAPFVKSTPVPSWAYPGFSMWYLWVLVLYKLLLPYLIRIPFILPISFLLSWAAGFSKNIGDPFVLSRFICFMPFFLTGYFVSCGKSSVCSYFRNCILRKESSFYGLLLLFGITILCLMLIQHKPGFTYGTGFNHCYGSAPITGLLKRIVLQFLILLSFYGMILCVPNEDLWIAKFGRKTMNCYLLHGFIVLFFAYRVFPPLGSSWELDILMIFVPTLICLLFFTDFVDKIMNKILYLPHHVANCYARKKI